MLGGDGAAATRRFERALAVALLDHGWSQDEIAAWLDTSQSRVSRLVSQLLPSVHHATAREVEAEAVRLAVALAGRTGRAPARQRVLLDVRLSDGDGVRLSWTVRPTTRDSATEIVSALEVVAHVLQADVLASLFPHVGLNVVGAPAIDVTPNEVVAFPGRLQLLDGRLRMLELPRAGASRHMAGLLCSLLAAGEERRFMLNLRPPSGEPAGIHAAVTAAAHRLGWTIADVSRGQVGSDAVGRDLLVDEGAHGWEPALYLAAATPASLVDRAHALAEAFDHPLELTP